jgi:hypothetical protein
VIDVSDRANPFRVGRFHTRGHAVEVAISDNRAYLLDSEVGLRIVDVSEPAQPEEMGRFELSDPVSVVVSGSYAYVMNGDGIFDLHVIEVSDPTDPRRVGGYPHGSGCSVSGAYAYVISGEGIEVVDVSNPADPRRAGIVRGEFGEPISAWSVLVSGDYLYATSGSILEIVDVRNPASSSFVGRYEGPPDIDFGPVAAISNDKLYLTRGGVVDVSEPAQPRWLGGYHGSIQGVVVSGNYAYIADETLQIVDATRPANPQQVGRYSGTGGSAQRGELFVSGPLAYVADGASGLQIIDISEPASPQRLGGYDTPGTTESVFVSGGMAYTADWDAGLQVIDVIDPARPKFVASRGLPDFFHPSLGVIPEVAERVFVSGDYAYVTGWAFHVIDVSDPAQPVRVGSAAPRGGALDIYVEGQFAYVAGVGLHVYDIRDPARPLRVGGYDTGNSTVRSVSVSGSYVYLAVEAAYLSRSALLVLDVSDPSRPRRVGHHTTRGGALSVSVSGPYAFLTTGQDVWGRALSGLEVFDVSDPAEPVRVGGNSAFQSAYSEVFASGENVFVATGAEGLLVLEAFRDPAALRLETRPPLTAGTFRFQIDGTQGISGRIQRSIDLEAWEDWIPFSLDAPPLEVTDPGTSSAPLQFYRAVSP